MILNYVMDDGEDFEYTVSDNEIADVCNDILCEDYDMSSMDADHLMKDYDLFDKIVEQNEERIKEIFYQEACEEYRDRDEDAWQIRNEYWRNKL